MTGKVKGMFGSESRADEVLAWLKSQGAEEGEYRGCSESYIYYVDKGIVKAIDIKHSVLFDIVELPRWRAERGKTYCYVSDGGDVRLSRDLGDDVDECRYKNGNYFKTVKEAEPYAEKIREIFKRKETE